MSSGVVGGSGAPSGDDGVATALPFGAVYTGLFVDDKKALLTLFPPQHSCVHAHHVTLEYKPRYGREIALGRTHNVRIVQRVWDERADALVVECPLSTKPIPHITLSVAHGTAPVYTDEMLARAARGSAGVWTAPADGYVAVTEGYFNGSDVTAPHTDFSAAAASVPAGGAAGGAGLAAVAAHVPPAPAPALAFADKLASATPEQRKNMIGERLYGLITGRQPAKAGQITGMLLEGMDEMQLLTTIEFPHELEARIREALDVLAAAEGHRWGR